MTLTYVFLSSNTLPSTTVRRFKVLQRKWRLNYVRIMKRVIISGSFSTHAKMMTGITSNLL